MDLHSIFRIRLFFSMRIRIQLYKTAVLLFKLCKKNYAIGTLQYEEFAVIDPQYYRLPCFCSYFWVHDFKKITIIYNFSCIFLLLILFINFTSWIRIQERKWMWIRIHSSAFYLKPPKRGRSSATLISPFVVRRVAEREPVQVLFGRCRSRCEGPAPP